MSIFLIRIFTFCVIVLGLTSCKNDLEELARIKAQDKPGVERAKDVHILYSDSAVVRVQIKAPIMLNHLDNKNPRKEFPEGVAVDFFDNFKNPTSYLTSRYAIHYEQERKVYLRDSVVVWNTQNEKLETEELIWKETQESISSDKFVRITTPNQILYGYGFTSDMDFTNWEIKDVKGFVSTNSFSPENNPINEQE